MGVFLYEARNRAGELFAGTIEAKDKREAAGLIRRRGLWIASLSPQEEKKAGGPAWQMQFTRLNAMPAAKLRVLFLRQMAAMMQAGMPVHQALEILSRSDGNPPYQSFLQDLLKGIMAGHPLHEMLAQHPRLFSASLCGLVRAGEASGSLTQIFAQLADFEEHRYEAREALKSALLYPVILLVVAVVSLCARKPAGPARDAGAPAAGRGGAALCCEPAPADVLPRPARRAPDGRRDDWHARRHDGKSRGICRG